VDTETAFSPNRTKGVVLACLTATIWGTVPFGGKLALEGISAPALSVVRLLSAGLFIAFVVARRQGSWKALRRVPPPLVWLAALGLAGNYSAYMYGLDLVSQTLAQVLIQMAPLFLILLSVVILGERPVKGHWVGTALATVGFVSVSLDGKPWGEVMGSTTATGIALLLLAAVTWAVYAVCHKRLGKEMDSGVTLSWIFLLAALLTAPVAMGEKAPEPDGVVLAAIGYLILNSVVAYWAFAESLRHVEASLVAVICTFAPVVTVTLSAAFNALGWERMPHDPLTLWKVGGAGLVVTGVALAVSAGGRKSTG
jgi:drug/metabolite transporter (DMT)-like permease